MLWITDKDGDLGRSDTPLYVVRLGTPHSEPVPAVNVIVCDVALDDLFAVQELRDLLTRYRRPDVPTHFIVRDGGIFSIAVANALGATTISSDGDPSSMAKFRELRRFVAPPRVRSAPGEPDHWQETEIDIGIVATSLARILGAAAMRKPFEQSDLDEGIDALLRSTKDAGISAWIDIVRRYDDATYQHCLLVAGLTAAFTAQLGLTVAKQRLLMQAALLHDIGKARVPLSILNKAGPLTAGEQIIVRRHPADGYYMLARQHGIDPTVLDIVLHHHEMLDGTGYPDGLRKERISDAVRIVTICDISAALLERRAYKQPMSAKETYKILTDMGSKLDLALVGAFQDVLDNVSAYKESARVSA